MDGKAAVRLSLSNEAELCRGQMIQVGILLTVPEALRSNLEAAKTSRGGLLMANSAKISKGAKTLFEFSQQAKKADRSGSRK